MDQQFRGAYKIVFRGTVAVGAIASTGAGSGTSGTVTVTVPGAQIGDAVELFPQGGAALAAGLSLIGDVSAANTVRVTGLNNTAGTASVAAQNYKIIVYRANF